MTLRSTITGDYTRAETERLSWPIAWSGPVSENQREEEGDLSDLVDEMMAMFNNPYLSVVTVTVTDGEITDYAEATSEDDEGEDEDESDTIEEIDLYLVRHVPSGEVYIHRDRERHRDYGVLSSTTLGICGPLHYSEWRNPETDAPFADWFTRDWDFISDDVPWANDQEWATIAHHTEDKTDE